jgi:hypothetical protein
MFPAVEVDPEQAFRSYEQELDLLESAARSGAPTQDERSSFFGLPFDDFTGVLRALRDDIEAHAYLAIVAAAEAVLQMDFRARARGRAAVPLREEARNLDKEERERGRRIRFEDVLDAWKDLPGVRAAHLSQFEQLLPRRHWLAHGRYFARNAPVPGDPNFAIERVRALLRELGRVDQQFPRG